MALLPAELPWIEEASDSPAQVLPAPDLWAHAGPTLNIRLSAAGSRAAFCYQHSKSCPFAPTQLLSFAEALTALVVTGTWDTCLAQALAAEVSERRLAHAQWEQQNHKRWLDKEAEEFQQARDARKVMDTFAKRIYDEVTSSVAGDWAVRSYLRKPMLCSWCLNVMDSVAPCLAHCGRQLCTLCRSPLGICVNSGTCRQAHPIRWKVGVKICNRDTELFQQWRTAADESDRLTDIVGWGHRSAAC